MTAPIGPLNQARREKVSEVLGPGYIPQPTPIPNAAVLINQAERQTVFVADGQMNFTQDGDSLGFDHYRWLSMLTGMRDALLLDDQFNGMMQIVSHVEAQGSATEQSVHFFSPLPDNEMRERFDGLRGIGLRINYERPPYICDIALEPFFQQTDRFFLKLNATGQQPMHLERLVQDASELCDYLNEDTVRFLEDCLRD